MASPRRTSFGLAGLGLALGAAVGWVLGLVRAPARGPGGDDAV